MSQPFKVIPPDLNVVPPDVRLRILNRLRARIGPAEFGRLLATLGEDGLLKMHFFQLRLGPPAVDSERLAPKWKQWLRENGTFVAVLLSGGIVGMICGYFVGGEPGGMALWGRLVDGFLGGVVVVSVTLFILAKLFEFLSPIFSGVKNFVEAPGQQLAAQAKQLYMLKHDLKEFVSFECPVCGESMTEEASRWGGSVLSAKQGNLITCECCGCKFALEPEMHP